MNRNETSVPTGYNNVTGAIIGILGIALGGIFLSKKKKEDIA